MQQRSFLRYFMGLALPVILQQLLAHLLAMSDTIMLGAFSEDAISAVSVANKYFFIYNLVIFGLSNGVGLFISQYHGALQKENENRTLRFGLRLCVYTAIIFMVILLVFPSFIMSLFVKNEVLIRLGNVYNGIVVFSYLPYALAQMLGVGYRVIAAYSYVCRLSILPFEYRLELCLDFWTFWFSIPWCSRSRYCDLMFTHRRSTFLMCCCFT